MIYNSKVLVVGGNSSVGRAIVERFISDGCSVTATYNSNKPSAGCLSCDWRYLDLADTEGVDRFGAAMSPIGFNVVLTLSGLLPGLDLQHYSADQMANVYSVNFGGHAQLIGRILGGLSDDAVVIMVASISGERGSFDPVYAAAKAGVVGFVKSMAVWHAPRVRFVAVAPALIEGSGMMQSMLPSRRAVHRDASPLKRLISPSEFAEVLFDLQRPHWAFANGSCIRLNGGAYV